MEAVKPIDRPDFEGSFQVNPYLDLYRQRKHGKLSQQELELAVLARVLADDFERKWKPERRPSEPSELTRARMNFQDKLSLVSDPEKEFELKQKFSAGVRKKFLGYFAALENHDSLIRGGLHYLKDALRLCEQTGSSESLRIRNMITEYEMQS